MQNNWDKLQNTLKKHTKKKNKYKRDVSAPLNLRQAFTLPSQSQSPSLSSPTYTTNTQELDPSLKEPTQVLAMDCEFVGCGPGGRRSALARVSIVNFHGYPIYDRHVRPKERVVDYRTKYSGIRAKDLRGDDVLSFEQAAREVSDILDNKTVVGHSLSNDFSALYFHHPKILVRDTSSNKFFCPFRPRSLKDLSKEYLGRDIQGGEHCSVEDARAALDLYKLRRKQWESRVAQEARKGKKKKRDGMRKFR